MKKLNSAAPGQAPPRLAMAVAAAVTTTVLHGALLGLFHQQTPNPQLLATPELERQLAACWAQAGRAEQKRCRLAVVQRARQAPAVTVASQR